MERSEQKVEASLYPDDILRVEVRGVALGGAKRAVAEWGWWRRGSAPPYSYAFTPLGLQSNPAPGLPSENVQRLKEDKKSEKCS